MAQCADQRDGRRTGRQRAGHRPPPTVDCDAAKWSEEDAEAFKAPIRQKYEDEGNPYYAIARLRDDGVIDPAQTRDVLCLALSATLEEPIAERAPFGIFRM